MLTLNGDRADVEHSFEFSRSTIRKTIHRVSRSTRQRRRRSNHCRLATASNPRLARAYASGAGNHASKRPERFDDRARPHAGSRYADEDNAAIVNVLAGDVVDQDALERQMYRFAKTPAWAGVEKRLTIMTVGALSASIEYF